MATFHYTAKKGPDNLIEGTIEAENRSGVLAYLMQLGYTPVRINEQTLAQAAKTAARRRAMKPRRVPVAQLTVFTRQFASLVRSQVPLLRTLQILEEQAKHPYFLYVLQGVTEEVRQGQTLSASLGKFPTVFPPLFVSLVRSGEISGALDEVLERLADQAEHDETLRAQVRAAFMYPAFVAAVGACSIVFLMTFVMPRLSVLLTGLGEKLPGATKLLLAISGAMSNGWFWGGAALAAAALAGTWKALGERGKLARDLALLRLPIVGPLVKEVELARFARSFGLLIRHGVSVLEAMEVTIPVANHRVIRRELAKLPEGLRQGGSLSSGLKGLSVSTPFLVNTVAVGEEGGRVGEALTEVANYYERSAQRSIQAMASLLEPALIVVIGVIVGFIVMAVLLPIFDMSSLAK
jgi:type II secretory pathway component PulF